MEDYKPKVVCFSCKFGWGYLADEKELAAGLTQWMPTVCSGKIETSHILEAFKQGVDGVLILGCPEDNCHFQDGNFRTAKRIYLIQKILAAHGIEPERLTITLASDPEGRKIPQLISGMKSRLAKLGPTRLV